MVDATLTVCFSSNKEEGFRYFDGLMRRWNMDYINPYDGMTRIMRSFTGLETEEVHPSEIDGLFRSDGLHFIQYWEQTEAQISHDLLVSCKERGRVWEFSLTDPATGWPPQWHGSAVYVHIVQEVIRDAITRFGGNFDDKPMLTLMIDT